MGYVLVLISVLASGEVEAQHQGSYTRMNECFHERELMLKAIRSVPAQDPISYQAVCIRTPGKK